MRTYFLLSLRKAKLAAAGLAAGFVFSLLIAPRCGRSASVAPRQAVDAALLFWAVLGVPLAALILGGSGGAETRAAAELEGPLPLTAERRALLALAAAFAILLGLAALVAATAAALGWDWRQAATIVPALEPMLASYLWVIGLVAAYALMLSFGAAFALGSGVAGGLVGAIFALVTNAALFGAFVFHLVSSSQDSFPLMTVVCAAAALGTAARFTISSARETRRASGRWLPRLRRGAVLLSGVVFVFLCSRIWIERFVDRLKPFSGFAGSATLTPQGELKIERRELEGGRLLSAMNGRLVWDDGRRMTALVPPRSKRAEDSLESNLAGAGDLYRLKDGSLWLLRATPARRVELWGAPKLGPLALKITLPQDPFVEMVVDGPKGPELLALGGKRLHAPLDLSRPFKWTPLPDRRARVRKPRPKA